MYFEVSTTKLTVSLDTVHFCQDYQEASHLFNGHQHTKYKVTLNITLHIKINSKETKDPNFKVKALKPIQEILSVNLHDLNSGNELFRYNTRNM